MPRPCTLPAPSQDTIAATLGGASADMVEQDAAMAGEDDEELPAQVGSVCRFGMQLLPGA